MPRPRKVTTISSHQRAKVGPAGAEVFNEKEYRIDQAWWALRLTYGLVAFLPGLDVLWALSRRWWRSHLEEMDTHRRLRCIWLAACNCFHSFIDGFALWRQSEACQRFEVTCAAGTRSKRVAATVGYLSLWTKIVWKPAVIGAGTLMAQTHDMWQGTLISIRMTKESTAAGTPKHPIVRGIDRELNQSANIPANQNPVLHPTLGRGVVAARAWLPQ